MVKYFAYNGSTNTYCPVSEPGNDSGDNKNHPPKDSFRKPLRIISLEGQIPTIFDNPDELIIRSSFKSSKYSGKIDDVPIEIRYIRSEPCCMIANSEEDLNRAHKKALDRLIHGD